MNMVAARTPRAPEDGAPPALIELVGIHKSFGP
jgi:hypothetical protein